jgi:hypothetical protein
VSSEWSGLQLVLALDSPLHLGWRLTGNLKQTRRYVPGRALWGAITDRYCRQLGQSRSTDFEAAGLAVHRDVRFTCGFVSDDVDTVTTWPWLDEDYFDWKHLQSYASTALVEGNTNEPGSLHETEYLAPFTRESCRVYLHFLLWRRNGFDALGQAAFWRGFQMGGERGYGWGRMQRAVVCREFSEAIDWEGWRFAPQQGQVTVAPAEADSRPPTLSHVAAEGAEGWSGAVEPLLGRLTMSRVPGRKLSKADVCFVPGATYLGSSGCSWQIGDHGIWRPVVSVG